MKILFSAGYLYRYPFANNNIELSLAEQLTTMGHTCHLCGFSTDLCGEEVRPSGVTLNRHNPYPPFMRALMKLERFVLADTTEANRIALAKRFALRHPFSAALVILSRREFFYKNVTAQYRKFIAQYAAQHKIDAMVCFAYPFPLAKAAIDANCGIPCIYYQFDPYGLHETLPAEQANQRVADECDAMASADATITTHALLAQYQQHPTYATVCDKLTAFDFPTFGEKTVGDVAPAFTFDAGHINLLFCGTLDDAFRSPRFFLDACVPLFESLPNLRLYFLGALSSTVLGEYAARYPAQIILHPIVESEIAAKTIAEADVLLNIGNSITNMMPSKIFDYFATGKPIVNVQKIQHCPARPYFEQYPLQLTLDEFAGDAADGAGADATTANNAISNENGTTCEPAATAALAAFLAHAKGKQLPFAEVLPLYQTATPRYVAQALERMIKEVNA